QHRQSGTRSFGRVAGALLRLEQPGAGEGLGALTGDGLQEGAVLGGEPALLAEAERQRPDDPAAVEQRQRGDRAATAAVRPAGVGASESAAVRSWRRRRRPAVSSARARTARSRASSASCSAAARLRGVMSWKAVTAKRTPPAWSSTGTARTFDQRTSPVATCS